ncbi:MAG: 2-dehydropantoate 2-reductase [Spirochaetales bacterium]|nr:2-dehydropantoate 2-reductase [Spirochaetales bacterium]
MAKNIAVVGAGAIGGAIGGYLTEKGLDVTLIDQWPAHVEAMKKKGLEITDRDRKFTITVKALHLSEVSSLREKFDIVFLSVKSYDTRWSTYLIEPMLKPTGFILPAQNALNDELVAGIVGYNRTVGCVPTISSGVYEPGRLIRTSPNSGKSFTVGELNGRVTPRAKEVVEMLQAVGPSEITTNIWGARWTKLQVNCMSNSVAGLIGPELQFLDDKQQDLAMLVRVSIAAEVVRVGQALGIAFEPLSADTQPGQFASATTRKTIEALKDAMMSRDEGRQVSKEEVERLGAPPRPSLLQDVMKGRRTEVEQLNGFIAQTGRQLGIPTPMNDAIVDVFARMDTGELKPGASNLQRLKPFIPG